MFQRRLYFILAICCLAVLANLARLAILQSSERRDSAREMIRISRIGNTTQLPTLRGGIYDRKNRELAVDKPRFSLQISYQLLRFLDSRFTYATIQQIIENEGVSFEDAQKKYNEKYKAEIENLKKIIDKCVKVLGAEREQLIGKIDDINERIWCIREVIAWKTEFENTSELYKEKGANAGYASAMQDFENLLEEKYGNDIRNQRFKLALKQDLAEMYYKFPVYDIESEEQLIDVQMAFIDMEGVEISPISERVYKYGSSACHIIGWVAPADPNSENELFPNDIYSQYVAEEYSGDDGIEKSCEVILRGRRGEITYSKDDYVINRKETLFGQDVRISIDIELQSKIEKYLINSIADAPDTNIGAVVLDVATGDILAMVSIPVYDLNSVRRKYGELLQDPRRPLINKAYYENYPPGSIAKPIILAIGLEENKVGPHQIIHCRARKAPDGWPNCLIARLNYYNTGHDIVFAGQGGNTGRNAIKGSCNIFFSVLADRIPALKLQEWLFNFGFGHAIMPDPQYPEVLAELKRTWGESGNLPEQDGLISSTRDGRVKNLLDLPPLNDSEKRMFGIGQASMRATVLQMANAMAVIARRGVYKNPNLYINDSKKQTPVDLGISSTNINVVRDGMHAVVNERGGTAYSAFKDCQLKERKIEIYGKTGSTQRPANALFGGFAEDLTGRAVALTIVVEGGDSGSEVAAPKARRIFELCSEAGYIGIDPKRLK